MGELIIAKHLGREWVPAAAFQPDIEPGIEVRFTTYHRGHLILHPADDDESRYWLVTGQDGNYWVRGSILGADGKREQFWRTNLRHPCFMVPQDVLNPP